MKTMTLLSTGRRASFRAVAMAGSAAMLALLEACEAIERVEKRERVESEIIQGGASCVQLNTEPAVEACLHQDMANKKQVISFATYKTRKRGKQGPDARMAPGIESAISKPLIDRIADNLPTWKGRLLNRSGRLALTKSTLSVILVYTTICIKLPPG
ncbi:hypothetical protein PR202_gb28662 [Eleusine coracana subsp. coracana]|uniref:Uncharacterized protein n=1 Tax=Eleusine coracana subsp. coracana TaxID=191504 RepID=A0AAV5FY46_ELECO|nr:hypothetical protein PR202_gb28662 [Eleusine coracana subsp. coracana]